MLNNLLKITYRFNVLKSQYIATIFLLLFSFNSSSNTVHSICNGNWSDSTTWDSGVPSLTDSVIIDHYVILDIDVTISAPGILIIHTTGTLCGTNDFTGAFYSDGPLYVNTLTMIGNCTNNAAVITLGTASGTGGIWTVNGPVTVGGTFTCGAILPCLNPIANFSFDSDTTCVGVNINVSNVSAYATIYQWLMPGANITTSSAINPTFHYDIPGNYVVTLITSNGTGTDTLIQVITILPPISFTAMSDTTVCKNTSLSLYASGSGTFDWMPSIILSCTPCNNPVFFASHNQTFYVTLTDKFGCKDCDTILVTISNPVLNLDNEYSFCINDSLQISLDDSLGYTYLWSDGNTNAFNIFYSEQTIFVSVFDSIGCSLTDSAIITQREPPALNINNDTTLCRNKSLLLYNSYITAIDSYLWNTGETTSTITVSDTGIYTLVISDRFNCKNSDTTKIIEVICECNSTHLPNAFSPNGSGYNDKLHVLGDDILLTEFMVFNRYGQKVFSTINVTDEWDGTFKGETLDPGVFAYLIIGSCKYTGEKILEKGNVTLVK